MRCFYSHIVETDVVMITFCVLYSLVAFFALAKRSLDGSHWWQGVADIIMLGRYKD